ncbi:MAG: acyltransferase [Myxococcota bacterium]
MRGPIVHGCRGVKRGLTPPSARRYTVSMEPAPQRRRRLESLTGLRFWAALLVAGFHLQAYGILSGEFAPFLRQGLTGVSFFFILSGFVLAWSHPSDDTPRRFWRRRFARVYPAHLVTWLIAAGRLVYHVGALPWIVYPSLVLVQAWVPQPSVYYAVNNVSWSLSCEAFFYAVFPFILPRLTTLPTTPRRALMVFLVVITVALAWACHPVEGFSTSQWLVYILPLGRLPEFLLGALVAVEMLQGTRAPVRAPVALVLAVLAYLVAGVVPESFRYASVTLVPYALLIAAVAQENLDAEAPRTSRVMVKLGMWSYAFYLVHVQLVILPLAQVFHAWWGPLGVLPLPHQLGVALAMVGASVVAAWLLHVVVEHPLERRLRGTTGR